MQGRLAVNHSDLGRGHLSPVIADLTPPQTAGQGQDGAASEGSEGTDERVDARGLDETPDETIAAVRSDPAQNASDRHDVTQICGTRDDLVSASCLELRAGSASSGEHERDLGPRKRTGLPEEVDRCGALATDEDEPDGAQEAERSTRGICSDFADLDLEVVALKP
jgi:hypothetical protein